MEALKCPMDIDALLEIVREEVSNRYGDGLNCLAYCKVLLEALKLLGAYDAQELVVRAVVLGKSTDFDYLQNMHPSQLVQLCDRACVHSAANSTIEIELTKPDSTERTKVTIPYRTVGYTHGAGELGELSDGQWSGHIVIVYNNHLIDPTIGQLNSEKFGILFNPPYILLAGGDQKIGEEHFLYTANQEHFIAYETYPDERSYLSSKSWSDTIFVDELFEVATRVVEHYQANLFSEQSVDTND